MAEASPPIQVPLIDKNCFLEKNPIGRGGFGQVQKAYDKIRYRDCAIKRPRLRNREMRDALMEEAKKMMQVRDECVLDIYGICMEGEMVYGLILPYMMQGSLDRLLSNGSLVLPMALRIRIIHEIARGMNALHLMRPHQLLHMDLKAANVLLTDNLNVKVADFGLARLKEKIRQSAPLTEEDTHEVIQGTVTHIAPEYLANEFRQPSTKFDIYSYGITVWEVLTRLNPFDHLTRDEMKKKVRMGLRPSLDALAGDAHLLIVDIMRKCWSPMPQDRPEFRSIVGQMVDLSRELDHEAEDCASRTTGVLLQDSSRRPCTAKTIYKMEQEPSQFGTAPYANNDAVPAAIIYEAFTISLPSTAERGCSNRSTEEAADAKLPGQLPLFAHNQPGRVEPPCQPEKTIQLAIAGEPPASAQAVEEEHDKEHSEEPPASLQAAESKRDSKQSEEPPTCPQAAEAVCEGKQFGEPPASLWAAESKHDSRQSKEAPTSFLAAEGTSESKPFGEVPASLRAAEGEFKQPRAQGLRHKDARPLPSEQDRPCPKAVSDPSGAHGEQPTDVLNQCTRTIVVPRRQGGRSQPGANNRYRSEKRPPSDGCTFKRDVNEEACFGNRTNVEQSIERSISQCCGGTHIFINHIENVWITDRDGGPTIARQTGYRSTTRHDIEDTAFDTNGAVSSELKRRLIRTIHKKDGDGQKFFQELGLTKKEMKDAYEKLHSGTLADMLAAMFEKWTQKEGERASRKRLKAACKKLGRGDLLREIDRSR